MRRSNAEYAKIADLIARGLNDSQVAHASDVPRSTVRGWRSGCAMRSPTDSRGDCPRCGSPEHNFDSLAQASYAYLLGMYLGDGDISNYPRTPRLRISLDMRWPDIISSCEEAARAVFPRNQVARSRPDPESRCAVVSVYSKQVACFFPQHGAGPKHLRPIQLTDWQDQIVKEEPEQFLRGLIHSDGCRFLNRVHAGGRTYGYPRYNFTNASADIRALFTASCDQLGVDWRRMNRRNISVARRHSVARLDQFIGPKR